MHILRKLSGNVAVSIVLLSTCLPVRAALSQRQVTLDHAAQDPSISPDGKQIAVGVLGKIWLIPIRGGDATQVTEGIGWDTHPAWSRDGRFLAYSHHIASGTDLVVLNLATKNSTFLYHTDADIGPIEYAPDGRQIYFVLRRGQYDAHILTISPGGGKTTAITEAEGWHEWSFALAPAGKDLIAESGHYGGANLYRIHLADRRATRLTRTEATQRNVAWTPDGKYFVYVEVSNGVETVFVQPVSGGARRAVYSSPYRDTQIALGPSDKFAILCAGRRLSRLDLGTGDLTPIPFRAVFELPQRAAADLTIVHARLIDGTNAPPVNNAAIEIRNGRFAAIHSGGEFTPPPNVPVIDAKGKTVLPGLMDNHYHFWDPFDGAVLLSRGITTIRDPGVDLSEGLNYKEAISLGIQPGPDIYTAGPLIDGLDSYHPMVSVEIDDAAKAASLVDSLKAQGVDLLKVYFELKPNVLCAVISEAHKKGLKVTGHIGVRTGWGRAIGCGIDGLNHIRVWADFLPLSEQPQGENGSLDGEIHPIARMQANWSQIDPNGAKVGQLIGKMEKARIGFDPTLSIQEIGDDMRKQLSLEKFTLAQEAFQRMGVFVVRAQKAGVPLLSGTDDGSLFEEVQDYERAGVPNAAIIRSATSNGAQWLGKQADFGTVQPGRRADLVIVNGDPLKQMKDIRNTRMVIKDGRIVFEK